MEWYLVKHRGKFIFTLGVLISTLEAARCSSNQRGKLGASPTSCNGNTELHLGT
jgi:hypothetical protein